MAKIAFSKPKCTWKDCGRIAEVIQLDRFGNAWAHLCQEHHDELEAAIDDHPRKLLACWVKASGGAETMIKRWPLGKAADLLGKLRKAAK